MRTIFISLLVGPALAASGCGSEDGGDGSPRVVATTGIVADLAATVAGPDVEVEQLIPDGSSPHDFQLSAEDRADLEQADLVLANGASLEVGIPLEELDAARWELAANSGNLLPFDEGSGDPHVWMDPVRVAVALPSLAAALGDADPSHAGDYERRARALTERLRRLDRELERVLAPVQLADRALITSHDSLDYFADRYRFKVLATAFPASGPEAEASAADLTEVEEAIEASGVSAVFASEEDDPEVLRLLADEAGVEVVDDLRIESPGDGSSYEEMLRRDAERIAGALDGD